MYYYYYSHYCNYFPLLQNGGPTEHCQSDTAILRDIVLPKNPFTTTFADWKMISYGFMWSYESVGV